MRALARRNAEEQLYHSNFLLGTNATSHEQSINWYWRACHTLPSDDARRDPLYRLIDRHSDRLAAPLLHDSRVTAAAIAPDSDDVATASEDGMIRFWNTVTGEPVGPRSNSTVA